MGEAAEHDESTAASPPHAKNHAHESMAPRGKNGHLRVKGPSVDVGVLKEPITFAFSGRTAKNRFLKASKMAISPLSRLP